MDGPYREHGTSHQHTRWIRLGGVRTSPQQVTTHGRGGVRAAWQPCVWRPAAPHPTTTCSEGGFAVQHRPRVHAERHDGSLFRKPGWYWTFHCDCGYRAPFWMLMTWPVALKFANTHVWASRVWEHRIDVEVDKFRAQLDEAM